MKKKSKKIAKVIEIGRNRDGKLKCLGGSWSDEWNNQLSELVAFATPRCHESQEEYEKIALAVGSGIANIDPADPIEGILIAQLMAANEAALAMYRRGWQQPPECFDAKTKYLALADKASRTVAMLTDRLDQHRNRGQQQIVVKHVTVNADQAMVADSITTSGQKPMLMDLETSAQELVTVGGGTKAT